VIEPLVHGRRGGPHGCGPRLHIRRARVVGDTWDLERANVWRERPCTTRDRPAVSGRSWCRALQMAGNAWEWTADWFDMNLYRQPRRVRLPGSPTTSLHADPARLERSLEF
jgi:formylglycine-generating enzyme required for sulfatase activity